jgi:hypothetical protein
LYLFTCFDPLNLILNKITREAGMRIPTYCSNRNQETILSEGGKLLTGEKNKTLSLAAPWPFALAKGTVGAWFEATSRVTRRK